VQRRSKKKGERAVRKLPVAASERVALTSSGTARSCGGAPDSDNDSLTAASGPSIKATLENQRQAASASSSKPRRAVARGELPAADEPGAPRLVDVSFINILSPEDGAESGGPGARTDGALLVDCDDDPFAGGSLPSFATVRAQQQQQPPVLPPPPLAAGQATGVTAAPAVEPAHWEKQMQVASGLGKYHSAMAAAREQASAASANVGRVGPATGRKFRRCVYDTELE